MQLCGHAVVRRPTCWTGSVTSWTRSSACRLAPCGISGWEPAAAMDTRFQTYLDAEMGGLSSRSLQGLVWCCHTCWSPAFASGTIAQRVRQRLTAYAGEHGLLTHWRQYADVLLGPSGPGHLAATLMAERAPIATFCRAWAIDERSPYVLAVLRHAMAYCLQEMVTEPALHSYLLTTLLPWSGWT